MAGRRSFGEISKLPSGRYRARYWGPDMLRHSAPVTFQAKLDAERWLADEDRRIGRGEWEPPRAAADKSPQTPSTLRGYARVALARRRLRPTTEELYRRLLDRVILPTFGETPLRGVTPDKVQTWYHAQRAQPTQQANAYALLKSIMKDAVDDGLIAANPCRVRGGSVKARAKEPETITVEELGRYVDAVPERYRVPLMLAGWCGLRSGEVRGVRRKDLDLAAGVVHVRVAVVKVGGRHVLAAPKTAAGVRDVAIPPHLLPGLREWLVAQPVRGAEGLLFPAADGKSPLSADTLRDAHVAGREAIGRPRLTIHGLRHTSATLAAQQGATVAELMARIGHTTPSMAMRYQHAAQTRDAEIAARLSSLVEPRGGRRPAVDGG